MSKLDVVMGEINKKYGEQVVGVGACRIYVEKVPFSSPRLNYMTYGGYPVGKAVEFFGMESGGKTTTALDAVAQTQKKELQLFLNTEDEFEERLEGLREKNNKSDQKLINRLQSDLELLQATGPRKCVYVDAENTLDEDWAVKLGVDITALVIIRPNAQTAEQVLQMMLDILDTNEVALLVLDSIPMLLPKALYEGDMEQKAYCGIAGPMTTFASKVPPKLNKYHATLIMINQLRDDIQNPYNLYKTTGGRALKHMFSLRILFKKGSFIDANNGGLKNSAEAPAGNEVYLDIAKTKVCKPDRKVGFYTLNYTNGIDVVQDTIDMAIKYEIIIQRGSWFHIIDYDTGEIMCDENDESLKFQGMASLLIYLRAEHVVFDELKNTVNQLLSV